MMRDLRLELKIKCFQDTDASRILYVMIELHFFRHEVFVQEKGMILCLGSLTVCMH